MHNIKIVVDGKDIQDIYHNAIGTYKDINEQIYNENIHALLGLELVLSNILNEIDSRLMDLKFLRNEITRELLREQDHFNYVDIENIKNIFG